MPVFIKIALIQTGIDDALLEVKFSCQSIIVSWQLPYQPPHSCMRQSCGSSAKRRLLPINIDII